MDTFEKTVGEGVSLSSVGILEDNKGPSLILLEATLFLGPPVSSSSMVILCVCDATEVVSLSCIDGGGALL